MKKGGKSGVSDEDRALWQRVTRSMRAYGKPAREQPARPRAGSSAKAAAPVTAPAKQPPAPTASARRITPARAQPPTDDGTARQLRKKKWPIDKTIDLHGLTQAAAHQSLLRFVAAAQRQGKRTLLVITGKGSRLAGGGVLRRMLPLWLEEEPLRGKVLACTPARTEDGGEGAFYLRLRKTPPRRT